jgi:hypothetical protein
MVRVEKLCHGERRALQQVYLHVRGALGFAAIVLSRHQLCSLSIGLPPDSSACQCSVMMHVSSLKVISSVPQGLQQGLFHGLSLNMNTHNK